MAEQNTPDNLDVAIQAGVYDIEYCEILLANREAFDITALIDRINVYEDIHSPFMSGQIRLKDTRDLPQFMRRGGVDLLQMSLKTNGIKDDDKNKIKGLFHIYRMGERELLKDNLQAYSFFFRSVESLYDFQTQISKSFSGTSDSIIGEILKKYYPTQKKKYNSKPSSHPHKFVSNFWIPSKCIEYCCQLAKHSKDDQSFLFYENRDGFNFQSIQDIIKEEKPRLMQNFQDSDYSIDITTNEASNNFGQASRNAEQDYKVVQEIRVNTLYDVIDTYSVGGLTTKMTSYDMLKKTIAVNTKTSSMEPRLNKFVLWPADISGQLEPKRFSVHKHYDVTNKDNSTNSSFIQGMVSEKRILNSSKIEIDVFGRTDYTIGKVIRFDSNKKARIVAEDKPEDIIDYVYGGFYIVTAINHQFTRIGHYCTIELSRESGLQE